ncbi:tryptophan--tRNA ligase [Candidatus Marsarchaeota archaeon]|jgi:tryptophanyl-tRNA synthetase|nr:tryptophan--tRNA ligase [Candidatus Marsarchaeota archaeon]MCL5092366.1 tryptophan--tRNA ligase [Candidatus Marsarchaeota archaeon]
MTASNNKPTSKTHGYETSHDTSILRVNEMAKNATKDVHIVSDTTEETKQQVESELKRLDEDKEKLIVAFGASRIEELKKKPDYVSFNNGFLTSHRDFDKFYERLLNHEKSAIVSGLNPSGQFHIGHIGVFDTNLFFQKEYGIDLYAPISDDESYVARKIDNQEVGLKNSFRLVKEALAYGYEPKKTHFIIDQIYTNIYNLAIKISRGINISTVRAIYDYKDSDNVGLTFYPSVQSAHVIFPQTLGIKNVLVPIGLDEDTHLRASRDVAEKFGYEKASVLHGRFLPGMDGRKMSKSKGNAVYLLRDTQSEVKKKVSQAFSGGRTTVDEHRKLGGVPEVDIAYLYLKYVFKSVKESQQLYDDYKRGRILSGEMKKMLQNEIIEKVAPMKERLEHITAKEMANSIMKNDSVDLESMIEKSGVMSEEAKKE